MASSTEKVLLMKRLGALAIELGNSSENSASSRETLNTGQYHDNGSEPCQSNEPMRLDRPSPELVLNGPRLQRSREVSGDVAIGSGDVERDGASGRMRQLALELGSEDGAGTKHRVVNPQPITSVQSVPRCSASHSGDGMSTSFQPSSDGVEYMQDSDDGPVAPQGVDVNREEDVLLANPDMWLGSIEGIESVAPKKWLGSDCIDRYLLQTWMDKKGMGPVHYIDTSTATSCARAREGLKHAERQFARQRIGLSTKWEVVKMPVVFVVFNNETQHYYLMAFDYTTEQAFAWGLDHTSRGPQIYSNFQDGSANKKMWTNIASIFGWRVICEPPKQLLCMNWRQNDFDCGADAVSLCERAFVEGLLLDSLGWPAAPTLECPHALRLRILQRLVAGITKSYIVWKALRHLNHWTEAGQPVEGDITLLERGLRHEYAHIEQALITSGHACGTCKQARNSRSRASPVYEDAEDESLLWDIRLSRDTAPQVPMEGGAAYPQAPTKAMRQTSSMLLYARCRATMVHKRPTDTSIELIAMPFKLLDKEKRRNFDEYCEGPSRESHQELLKEFGAIPSQQPLWEPSDRITRSIWELWRDWGWRIEPEFALMFATNIPQAVEQHILPVEAEENVQSKPDDFGKDGVTMGMQEMLEYAGEQGKDRSIYAFVGGKCHDGKYIRLDPARDARLVLAKSYDLTEDIDSAIITAHSIYIAGSVDIDVLAYGGGPLLTKGNHTYVEVLVPRSQDEIDQNPNIRTSWWTLKVSPSSLPHTRFGKKGPFEIYIFFPRMKHQDPVTRKWQTALPHRLHEEFLEFVVYPAVLAVEADEVEGKRAYVDYTAEEWRWKAASSSRFSGKRKHVAVNDIPMLQTAMREIQKHACIARPELNAFGSFFFVIEAKGIKMRTTVKVQPNAPSTEPDQSADKGGPGKEIPASQKEPLNAYDRLCKEYPYMDFDRYDNRENGQLLLDLGMGFYPKQTASEEHLVCMWDLERLYQAYVAGGMNMPTLYPINTMAQYGGCAAEMGQARSSLVQINYRITYGLTYEAVRRIKGGHISLCSDRDAYHAGHAFETAVGEYAKIMKSAGLKDHSWGVRDEIRGSGAAVRSILKVAGIHMLRYLRERVMICVPSRIFFQFSLRRLEELRATQLIFAKARPSNYGLCTTIIMFLIRSVCHSPTPQLPHLAKAFKDLSYEAHRITFGMAFLHTIDLGKGTIIDIEKVDDDKCRLYYSKKRNLYSKNVPVQAYMPRNADFVEPNAYPLGQTPTWREWQVGMENDPANLLKNLMWSAEWEEALDADSVGFFIRFTMDYLASLRGGELRAGIPEIESLKDAMSLWTVLELRKHIMACWFQPSNQGITGVKGNEHMSFKDMLNNFFPEKRRALDAPIWTVFVRIGYLKRFHLRCAEGTQQTLRTVQTMQQIFHRLQCLPAVDAGKSLWKATRSRGIQFWTNPLYFKLDSIGKARSFATSIPRLMVKDSNHEIERKILERNGEPVPSVRALREQAAAKVIKTNEGRRSGKTKNKRKAPTGGRGSKKNTTMPGPQSPPVQDIGDRHASMEIQPFVDPRTRSSLRTLMTRSGSKEGSEDEYLGVGDDKEVEDRENSISDGD